MPRFLGRYWRFKFRLAKQMLLSTEYLISPTCAILSRKWNLLQCGESGIKGIEHCQNSWGWATEFFQSWVKDLFMVIGMRRLCDFVLEFNKNPVLEISQGYPQIAVNQHCMENIANQSIYVRHQAGRQIFRRASTWTEDRKWETRRQDQERDWRKTRRRALGHHSKLFHCFPSEGIYR